MLFRFSDSLFFFQIFSMFYGISVKLSIYPVEVIKYV